MDAFLAICQGLGVALAVGLVVGAVVPPIMPTWGVLAGAVSLGVVACGLSLDTDDEPLWPALIVGPVAAGLAATIARDVAAGAARRARSTTEGEEAAQPSATLATLIVLGAISVALVSVLVPPLALGPLAGLLWLALARRRREHRKHEGLRVLR